MRPSLGVGAWERLDAEWGQKYSKVVLKGGPANATDTIAARRLGNQLTK